MGLVAAVIGSAVLGAGTSIYEGSQQQDANQTAQDTNQTNQTNLNNSNWGNYLLTRGISDPNPVAGSIPAAGTGTAVNTKLPLWANVNVSTPNSNVVRLVPKGTASTTPPPQGTITSPAFS